MIKIFQNKDFKQDGLVPGIVSIKNFFKSESIGYDFFSFEEIAELKNIDIQSIIRCDLSYSRMNLAHFSMTPENVRFSYSFDTLESNGSNLIPRLHYFDSLRRTLVSHFKKIDHNMAVGILAAEIEIYGLVSVAVSFGFKHVLIFSNSLDSSILTNLRKYFIGIVIEEIELADLTQNQIGTSLLLNNLDLESESQIMSDLAYFNFMARDGIVVDLFSKTPIHPILFEAEKAGLRTLKRIDVSKNYNYETLSRLIQDNGAYRKVFCDDYSEIETID